MLFTSLGANDEVAANALTPEELEQLIARNADAVYKLAFARLGNRADADDVFQQVFLRYLKKRPVFANATHERAWFLRVCSNCTKSWWNSAFRRHTAALTEDTAAAAEQPPDWELVKYLKKLPKAHRTVLHLFYYEDMSTADIAKLLGKKESTVRMQLTRARRQLKDIMKGAKDIEF